jgi:hypothetical protein
MFRIRMSPFRIRTQSGHKVDLDPDSRRIVRLLGERMKSLMKNGIIDIFVRFSWYFIEDPEPVAYLRRIRYAASIRS